MTGITWHQDPYWNVGRPPHFKTHSPYSCQGLPWNHTKGLQAMMLRWCRSRWQWLWWNRFGYLTIPESDQSRFKTWWFYLMVWYLDIGYGREVLGSAICVNISHFKDLIWDPGWSLVRFLQHVQVGRLEWLGCLQCYLLLGPVLFVGAVVKRCNLAKLRRRCLVLTVVKDELKAHSWDISTSIAAVFARRRWWDLPNASDPSAPAARRRHTWKFWRRDKMHVINLVDVAWELSWVNTKKRIPRWTKLYWLGKKTFRSFLCHELLTLCWNRLNLNCEEADRIGHKRHRIAKLSEG